jgi:predicted ATP-dependent endonuclease of OLD family
MQRILIEAMINKFPKLQVFLTTHSNHFLDLTYDYPTDVAIFSFEEIRKEKFKIKNISDNVKILDLLGIRNSSVFLANCVIWTEGVTDRMILRRILKLKTDFKYTEDRHYSFAEYGGSNLRNFNFINTENSDSVSVNSLSRKNYIIADNDNKNSGEIFNRRQNLKKTLGENSVFDNHIEIENLIPYKIWNLVINKILVDHPNKDIQRKVISNKTETAFNNGLSSEKIGLLLKKIIEKKGNADPKYFENKDVQFLGETKKTIAEYIISAIDESNISLDEFPQTTQVLVSKMHEFVTKANNE